MLSTFAMLAAALVSQPAGGPPGDISPEDAARFESKYLANIRQVTDEGQSGEGYFSPDMTQIVYQSIRGEHPFYQIFIRNLETGDERMVSTGKGRTTCAYFHPTKPKLIFASSHLDPNHELEVEKELKRLEELRRNPPARRSYNWAFDPYMNIFEADLDGTKLVQLTNASGYDAEGAYSPDGSEIVFCSFRDGSGNIYVMSADGTSIRQITDSPGYDGGPFFSPDGKRIIFRGEVRKRDYLQLFVINADGTEETQLTDNDAVNWGPYWHPDGKHIIFSTSLHGHYNYELYLMNVETRDMQRVTYTMGADVLPVFSPDGKKLMWTSRRGKNKEGETSSQLWIADWIYEP